MLRISPKISLIVCTLGERPDDLRTLLTSLVPQSDCIHQVIIVDQHNDPSHLATVLEAFSAELPILHTRSAKGLSRARNHGLPLASGDLVAFPDDDCVYPQGLLRWVTDWFRSNSEYGVLAVGVEDAMGVPSGNRWPQDSCDIRPLNAFRTTFSSSLFLRKKHAQQARFDTRLGVGSGTPYGSGEETDYVLRMMRQGVRARFDRTTHVIHPRRDMLSGGGSAARATSYGFGMGHLLRVHSLTAIWAAFITYNVLRAIVAFAKGNRFGSSLCLAQTQGIWNGFRHQTDEAWSH